MLVILSKNSTESEWCKKELNAGIIRELDEKQVIVLPCVIDDCEIPLFLRDKMRANFSADPDTAFTQVNDALLKISNRQQGRIESPEAFTDWSFDWKKNDSTGRWLLEWTFVDHSEAFKY
jgi:TIR domain